MAKQPFDPYNHFGFLTNRISRLINQTVENSLVDHGFDFPVSCIGIMADLWQEDGITQKKLGMSLIKTKSSITKMLAELAKEGLIIKKDDPYDKRNKLIYLTSKGRRLRYLVEKIDLSIEKSSLTRISDREVATTKKVLQAMYDNLSAYRTS